MRVLLAKQENSQLPPEQLLAFLAQPVKPLLQERRYVPHVRLANIKPLLALACVEPVQRVHSPLEQVTLYALYAVLVLLLHQQASRAALGAQQVHTSLRLVKQRAQRVPLAAFLLDWAMPRVLRVLLVPYLPPEPVVVPDVE